MLRFCFASTFVVLLLALPGPVPACSLCGAGLREQTPLRLEMEKAQLVVYGKVANPRFNPGGAAGSGTTDLVIEKILKYDQFIAGKQVVELDRYIPIIEPKDPPRFVVFCDIVKGRLDPYLGRQVKSADVLDYLDGAKKVAKDRVEALKYYFRFIDHADAAIADDAFLEFARSNDAEVCAAAKHLDAAKVRALLQSGKTNADRLGLCAFLLGSAGNDKDAELIGKLIEKNDDRSSDALNGLLAGFIELKPRQGWDWACKVLGDGKQSFKTRYAVVNTVRFYQAWKPKETRDEILRCYSVLIEDGDMADIPIEDLRKLQMWDLTDKILGQYGKKSHDAPIRRRTIVRYALCCPLQAARDFVEQVNRVDPGTIRELREGLELEKTP
jgi:hypothetical protein